MNAVFFDIIPPAAPAIAAGSTSFWPIAVGLATILLVAAAAIYRWIKKRPLRRAEKRLHELRLAHLKGALSNRLAAYYIAFELRQIGCVGSKKSTLVVGSLWLSLQSRLADLRYRAQDADNKSLDVVFDEALRWLKKPRC